MHRRNFLGLVRLGDMRWAFPGFGKAFLPSLVLAVSKVTCEEESSNEFSTRVKSSSEVETDDVCGRDRWDKTEKEEEEYLEERLYSSCKEWLLRVVTPEVMCKVARLSPSQHDDEAKIEHEVLLQETELNRASGKGSHVDRSVCTSARHNPSSSNYYQDVAELRDLG